MARTSNTRWRWTRATGTRSGKPTAFLGGATTPTPGQNLVKDGDLHKAHSTPVIVTTAGKTQMLSADAKAATAYDPLTGREIWKRSHTTTFPGARAYF